MAKAKKRREFQIGDRVTVKERVSGYGSGYAGNDVFFFSPGMEGTVGAVNVPAVWGNGSSTFTCVDFTLRVEWRDRTSGELLGTTTDQRCGVFPGNLVLLPE